MSVKISFILPCYNVAPYIGRCLESIELQNMPQSDYEVICVDDCSKDNTVDVIRDFQKQYDNIRLICHKENKTAGGARNTGLEVAQGEYIWFVDPDDCIEEDVLLRLYGLAKNKKADVLIFNYTIIDSNGNTHNTRMLSNHEEMLSGQQFFIKYCPKKRMAEVTSVWRCLFKLTFCSTNSLRFPEIKSSQDVVFLWNSFLKAQRLGSVEDIGYVCHKRDDSTTGKRGKYHAINAFSASILYPCSLLKLMETDPIEKQYVLDFQFEAGDSINTDSRRVLKMSLSEQRRFYIEMKKYSRTIVSLRPYMNKKTRNIFNFNLPFFLWTMMIFGYKIYGLLR